MILSRLAAEAAEMGRCVGKKAHRQRLWIALEAQTRQVFAFHGGDRRRRSVAALWQKIPLMYQEHAIFLEVTQLKKTE